MCQNCGYFSSVVVVKCSLRLDGSLTLIGPTNQTEVRGVEGPLLFNSLPLFLRDNTFTQEDFKKYLDLFLTNIPDQPSGKTHEKPSAQDIFNGRHSNSLRHWLNRANHHNWTPPHETTKRVSGCREAPANQNDGWPPEPILGGLIQIGSKQHQWYQLDFIFVNVIYIMRTILSNRYCD